MSNVAVVYWSGSGNTEAMAEYVVEGIQEAGGTAELIQAGDFSAADLDNYDAFAFGCPAMGDEGLESYEFEPMWDEVEPLLTDAKVSLFGSYDWNEGAWMDHWAHRAENAGVTILDSVIAKDYPDDEAAQACRNLGKALI